MELKHIDVVKTLVSANYTRQYVIGSDIWTADDYAIYKLYRIRENEEGNLELVMKVDSTGTMNFNGYTYDEEETWWLEPTDHFFDTEEEAVAYRAELILNRMYTEAAAYNGVAEDEIDFGEF